MTTPFIGLADGASLVGFVYWDLVQGEESDPSTITVSAGDGLTLAADPPSGLRVTARHGSGAWTDISTGLDLSAYGPGLVPFQIRAEAVLVTGRLRAAVPIVVRGTPVAAGWKE
jgi:hypothetical protein